MPANRDPSKFEWGAIDPIPIDSNRTRLDLGLARATRYFNNLTFPGTGGVSFVRQLTWSAVGIRVSEEFGVSAMRMAEAIEALAAYISIHHSKGAYLLSPRIRGRRKLGDSEDFSFKRLGRRGNYVAYPLRMGTGAALIGLQLANGSEARFNGLKLTHSGIQLADFALNRKVNGTHSVESWLKTWVDSNPRTIPGTVKDAILPGVPHVTQGNIPTKAEAILVMGQVEINNYRKIMVKAINETANLFNEIEGATLIDTEAGQEQFLRAIDDESQRTRVKAAMQYQKMCKCAVDILARVGNYINENSESTRSRSCAHLAKMYAAELRILKTACKSFDTTVSHSDAVQSEASAFSGEMQRGLPEVCLQRLIVRSKDYLSLVGGVVCLGRLYRKYLDLNDPDTHLDELSSGSEASTIPRRLRRAHSLLMDIREACA